MNLQFANFICRFGDNKVLIDLLEEIIIPAFQDSNLERDAGHSQYFFHNVEIVCLEEGDNPVLGIAGRYVQNTHLQRTQVYDKNTNLLRRDEQAIQSSPSSIFLLILNNHRLMYLSETPYAPSLNSFRSTVKKFINLKIDKHINDLYIRNKREISKKELCLEFPKVNLEIIPLGGKSDIRDFIQRFELLESVKINVLETNNELDNNDFFKELRKKQQSSNSDKIKLEYNSKNGLSKEYMTSEVSAATSQGIANVSLSGKDNQGNEIKGNNDSFKIKIIVDNISSNIKNASQELYTKFMNLTDKNKIDLGEIQDKSLLIDKLRDVNIRYINNE
jgi:hypothetical protein